MKKTGIFLAATALMLGAINAPADDTEIYINASSTAGTPYLHLMLDYRPSVFNTLCTYGPGKSCAPPFMTQAAYDILGTYPGVANNSKVSTFYGFVAVMQTVMQNPLYDPIKLALIAPNSSDGGTILKGYTLLRTGRQSIIDVLKLIPEATRGSEAHKLSPKETYFEWFRYLNGGQVLNGKNTTGNFTATGNTAPIPNYDSSIITSGGPNGTYISPFTNPNECPKLYSMMMAMNTENQDDDWNREIEAEMSAQAAARKFENMLNWLHRKDTNLIASLAPQKVSLQKTWVISDSGSVGQTPDWARAGGSGAVLSLADPQALQQELENAFKEVISVSSTFVAASVPVNVFNQTKTLDNLFVALFEARSTVRWPGNIKKLKLADTYDAKDPNDPAGRDGIFDEIVDVNGNPGFESTGDDRGRISFNALTFWTDKPSLPSGDGTTIPNNADGREVARGGAGQKIDGFVNYGTSNYFIGNTNSDTPSGSYGPRKLFVEPATITNGASNSFVAFNADTATVRSAGFKGLLDPANPTMSDADAISLVKWGRGQDVANNSAAARSWIMADAIHSRPFALNYGTAGGYSATNPNIRIFMGTGDGIFHIIENTDTAGNQTGREVFGFYPRELLRNIKLHKDNSLSALRMPYGVDGAPVVYTKDINKDGTLDYAAGDKAYVYFGLRRGGSSYYALDVSNPNDTKLLWKIGKTTGGDFDELGMTFSTPVVGKVKYGSTAVDVLVFAGGYNGGWNFLNWWRVGKDRNDDDDAVGNAIYIVNAQTGALIWKAKLGATGTSTDTEYRHAGLVDSIPSDVAVLENANNNIHRIYVGDTGGAVWRVDLPEGDGANHRRDNWFITKLAELGTDGATTDRRFFHAPDIVETFDASGDFDGVIIESGDRAHPNETNVENYMFYIKDRKIHSGSSTVKDENLVSNPPGRYVFDSAQANGLADQTACVTGAEMGCNASIPNGWKIRMQRAGEKGLSTPLVDGGRIFFTTFRPATAATCAPSEGEGSVYVVNLADGIAYANNQRIYEIGSGIPPGAILLGDVILLPGGGIDLEDLDGDGIRDISKLPRSLASKFFQIYWREPGIDKL